MNITIQLVEGTRVYFELRDCGSFVANLDETGRVGGLTANPHFSVATLAAVQAALDAVRS